MGVVQMEVLVVLVKSCVIRSNQPNRCGWGGGGDLKAKALSKTSERLFGRSLGCLAGTMYRPEERSTNSVFRPVSSQAKSGVCGRHQESDDLFVKFPQNDVKKLGGKKRWKRSCLERGEVFFFSVHYVCVMLHIFAPGASSFFFFVVFIVWWRLHAFPFLEDIYILPLYIYIEDWLLKEAA